MAKNPKSVTVYLWSEADQGLTISADASCVGDPDGCGAGVYICGAGLKLLGLPVPKGNEVYRFTISVSGVEKGEMKAQFVPSSKS